MSVGIDDGQGGLVGPGRVSCHGSRSGSRSDPGHLAVCETPELRSSPRENQGPEGQRAQQQALPAHDPEQLLCSVSVTADPAPGLLDGQVLGESQDRGIHEGPSASGRESQTSSEGRLHVVGQVLQDGITLGRLEASQECPGPLAGQPGEDCAGPGGAGGGEG